MERLISIYASFRRLHHGTQVWMMIVLGPAIFLPLLAMDGPLGPWVAILSILGFAPAPPIIWRERGFSGKLSLAHLIFWPPLVAWLIWYLAQNGFDGSFSATVYAITIAVFSISIAFDIREASRWWCGKRAIA